MLFTRFTFSTAAAMVVLLAAACGAQERVAPSATSDSRNPVVSDSTLVPQPTPTLESPTQLPATSTLGPPAATVTTEGCYDRGYAGIVRNPDGEKGVTTYGLVEPPDDPNDAARAVAETWCVMNGRFTPPGEVRVIKVDYTLKQLEGWYALLRDRVSQIEGLWYTSIDEGDNRLSYGVLTELGQSKVFKIAKDAGIPAAAIYADIPPQIELDIPQAIPSDSGMEISVEYAGEMVVGESIEFSVVVKNLNDQEKTIGYNSAYPADIAILDTNGSEIWRHMTGVIIQPGGQSLLLPGDSITFAVTWSGLNHDGIAVSSGQYLVRGFATFGFEGASSEGRYVAHKLSTAPQVIRIVGR